MGWTIHRTQDITIEEISLTTPASRLLEIRLGCPKLTTYDQCRTHCNCSGVEVPGTPAMCPEEWEELCLKDIGGRAACRCVKPSPIMPITSNGISAQVVTNDLEANGGQYKHRLAPGEISSASRPHSDSLQDVPNKLSAEQKPITTIPGDKWWIKGYDERDCNGVKTLSKIGNAKYSGLCFNSDAPYRSVSFEGPDDHTADAVGYCIYSAPNCGGLQNLFLGRPIDCSNNLGGGWAMQSFKVFSWSLDEPTPVCAP